MKKVTISEKTQVHEYVTHINPGLLDSENASICYSDSHDSSLLERMKSLERINSDLSVMVDELNERLSCRNSSKLSQDTANDHGESFPMILEEYRKAILELVSERDILLLNIPKSDLPVDKRMMKRIRSSPNISLNPKLHSTSHVEINSIYPSPEGESCEENILTDHEPLITSSKDCNNILMQYDATRNISFTDIKRPLIFESQNSWTYIDKRITVSLLPRNKPVILKKETNI